MRIFSGIKPSGVPTLGNYSGGFRQYAASQERGEGFFCIVDLHAITVAYDPVELRERTYDTAAILLAAGLDPARCTLFRQSDVGEHAELTWLLSSVTELGRLQVCGNTWSHPACANGKLYIRDGRELQCLDLRPAN